VLVQQAVEIYWWCYVDFHKPECVTGKNLLNVNNKLVAAVYSLYCLEEEMWWKCMYTFIYLSLPGELLMAKNFVK